MILICAAMKEEVKEILKHPHKDVDVLLTGIGKVNAAAQLAKYLSKHQVKAIYNLGFAGASSHFNVSDVIVIEKALYHDFDLTLFGYQKGQVPGFEPSFVSDPSLFTNITSWKNIKSSTLYTGDYFMTETKEIPFVVDMEGAALYQTAKIFNIPIISVKVVSDVLGMDKHYENYKAFEKEEGSKKLLNIYQKLIGGLSWKDY